MPAIRKVAATTPGTGEVVTRQSKTKHYTHALVIHWNEIAEWTIPAGTYTVPAKRIRGFNVPAYTSTHSSDYVMRGSTAGSGIVSFHQGLAAADKAGRAYVSKSASSHAEAQAIYGDLVPALPRVASYEIVEAVEV